MNIIALNGSPDKNGNTVFLLNTVLDTLEAAGANTRLVHLQELILACKTPFCVNCSSPCNQSCYQDTPLFDLLEDLTACDAVLFGSPVYFGSMSAQLKCFFDKTRALRAKKGLVGKLGAALVCGGSLFGGQEATIRAIHDCMLVDGMTILGSSSAQFGAGHFGVAAQKPAWEDKNAISRAGLLANRILEELR